MTNVRIQICKIELAFQTDRQRNLCLGFHSNEAISRHAMKLKFGLLIQYFIPNTPNYDIATTTHQSSS